MSLFVGALLQTVLVVPGVTGPVRFGVPVPRAAVQAGLRLRGPGHLRWQRLPVGDAASDPVWVSVAIEGVTGTVRIHRGDGANDTSASDPVGRYERRVRLVAGGREVVTRWRWRCGVVDERVRREFQRPGSWDDESYTAGEAWTDCGDQVRRAAAVCRLDRGTWQAVGLLPPRSRSRNGARRRLRRALVVAERALVELPGRRGAGDFARGDGTITNGEFDTAYALLRFALATGSERAFGRAVRAAHHLRDRDLDGATGLPFPHGGGHRTGVPEPGHVWLQGLLYVGLVLADDELIETALSIGHALAARPPLGRGRKERARDYAWPLLELEALLRVVPDPGIAAAADRLAAAIAGRFDPGLGTFRFGEGNLTMHADSGDGPGRGRSGDGGRQVYLERAWLTGGIVLPALRAHLRRRPSPRLARVVGTVEAALARQVGRARSGVPTHWRIVRGRPFREHRVEGDPRAVFVLAGLDGRSRRRLLGREELADALDDVVRPEDPDLATTFTLVARTSWVWQ
ncbi:MAG: hypothetical protein NXI31_03785 [bacterium]|nr:hypothetical protein [bacterium]